MNITDEKRERILALQNIAAGHDAPISEERRQALLNVLNSLPEGTKYSLFGDYNVTSLVGVAIHKNYEIEIVIKV
jgi:hypothetical protein